MSKQLVGFAVVLLCFGAAGWFAFVIGRAILRRMTWVAVEAKVVRAWSKNVSSTDSNGNHTTIRQYYARYDYTTPDGQLREGKDRTPRMLKPGDEVRIRYDPKEPSRSETGPGTVGFWIVTTIGLVLFAGIGVLAVAAALS